MKYVPDKYIDRRNEQFTLWYDVKEDAEEIQKIFTVIKEAIEETVHLLKFFPCRKLHFCMYGTNTEARKQLNRPVNGSMFMAPLSSSKYSLIVFHSPVADLRNGDRKRVKRHLIHEICHQFINEKSKSTKKLGDNNKYLNTPPWFNEGLSEVIALKIMKLPIVKVTLSCDLNLEDLNENLESLFSEIRSSAFEQATTIVNHLAKQHGIIYIFNKCFEINDIYNNTMHPTGRVMRL